MLVMSTVLQMMSQRHTDPILSAAYLCVMDVGLRRTTVADIARRAGVSRMTFYRQYGDLSAVVSALMTAELVGMLDEVQSTTSQLPLGRTRVVELIALGVQALSEHPLLRRVLDLDPEALLPYIVDRRGSSQESGAVAIQREIEAGLQDGSIRPVDPATATDLLLLTGQSLVFSSRMLSAGQRWDAVLGELRVMIDGYLAP